MIAQSIMEKLRSAGITLTCRGDVLRASPKSRLDEHLRSCIREHKPELLALLSTPSGARHHAIAARPAGPLSQAIDLAVFTERCAILQYDSGLSRQEAEQAAVREAGHECIEELHAAAIKHWRGEILALPERINRDGARLVSMSLDFLANITRAHSPCGSTQAGVLPAGKHQAANLPNRSDSARTYAACCPGKQVERMDGAQAEGGVQRRSNSAVNSRSVVKAPLTRTIRTGATAKHGQCVRD